MEIVRQGRGTGLARGYGLLESPIRNCAFCCGLSACGSRIAIVGVVNKVGRLFIHSVIGGAIGGGSGFGPILFGL